MEQPASREPEALESNQDSRLPDDLLQLLYVKQLSPSDAASSKQIKLPKNEVKGFLGDLRHKQRCMVVVLDHKMVCWEFLCTCYGCQYALSRVAAFANTYQLRPGQFIVFYQDTLHRLRMMVSNQLPQELQQQPYPGMPPPTSTHLTVGPLLLAGAITAQPHPAAAAAAGAAISSSSGGFSQQPQFILPPAAAAAVAAAVATSTQITGFATRARPAAAAAVAAQSQAGLADHGLDVGRSGSNGGGGSNGSSDLSALFAGALQAGLMYGAAAGFPAGQNLGQQQQLQSPAGFWPLFKAPQSHGQQQQQQQQQQEALFTFGAASSAAADDGGYTGGAGAAAGTAAAAAAAAAGFGADRVAAAAPPAAAPPATASLWPSLLAASAGLFLGKAAAGPGEGLGVEQQQLPKGIGSSSLLLPSATTGSWGDDTTQQHWQSESFGELPQAAGAAVGSGRPAAAALASDGAGSDVTGYTTVLGKRARAAAEAFLQPRRSVAGYGPAAAVAAAGTVAAAEADTETVMTSGPKALLPAPPSLTPCRVGSSSAAAAAPAAAAAAVSHSGDTVTPAKAAAAVELSPACSVAPARAAAAAKNMNCNQQPFQDLLPTSLTGEGRDLGDRMGSAAAAAGSAAGWKWGGLGAFSSSGGTLCPPIFQAPATAVTAAGAAAVSAAVGAGAGGGKPNSWGVLGSFGGSSTGPGTADAAASVKLPSLDDILLLHHMQEQQRKQQRQQQLALLQSFFLSSYSSISGSNKRVAATGSSTSSSPCAGSSLSGVLNSALTQFAVGASPVAPVGGFGGSSGGGGAPALLPLFKIPAPRASFTGSIAGSTSTNATLVQDPAMFDHAAPAHGSSGGGAASTGGGSSQQQHQQQQGYGQQYQQSYQQQQGGSTPDILSVHQALLKYLAGNKATAVSATASAAAAAAAAAAGDTPATAPDLAPADGAQQVAVAATAGTSAATAAAEVAAADNSVTALAPAAATASHTVHALQRSEQTRNTPDSSCSAQDAVHPQQQQAPAALGSVVCGTQQQRQHTAEAAQAERSPKAAAAAAAEEQAAAARQGPDNTAADALADTADTAREQAAASGAAACTATTFAAGASKSTPANALPGNLTSTPINSGSSSRTASMHRQPCAPAAAGAAESCGAAAVVRHCRALSDVTTKTVNGCGRGGNGSNPFGSQDSNGHNTPRHKPSPNKVRPLAAVTASQQQQQGVVVPPAAVTATVGMPGSGRVLGGGITPGKSSGTGSSMRALTAGVFKVEGRSGTAAAAATAAPAATAAAAARGAACEGTSAVSPAARTAGMDASAAAAAAAAGAAPKQLVTAAVVPGTAARQSADELSAASGLMLLLQGAKP